MIPPPLVNASCPSTTGECPSLPPRPILCNSLCYPFACSRGGSALSPAPRSDVCAAADHRSSLCSVCWCSLPLWTRAVGKLKVLVRFRRRRSADDVVLQVWDIRTAPGVVGAFEKLWGTNELVTSFDGAFATFLLFHLFAFSCSAAFPTHSRCAEAGSLDPFTLAHRS